MMKKNIQELKISRKTVMRTIRRNEKVELPNSNKLWEMSNKLPWKYKPIIESLISLIEEI